MENRRFNPHKLEKLNHPERAGIFPVKEIIKLLKIERPEVIIDLGAGTGFFSIPFARKYRKCRVYACDISNTMIGWMNKNVVPEHENIIPLKMKDSQIRLKGGIADFLFMVNLHHELHHPEKTLEECFRLLKPGGKIAISDWKKERTEHGPPLEIRYDPKEVKEQLKSAGFYKLMDHNDFMNNFLIAAEKPR